MVLILAGFRLVNRTLLLGGYLGLGGLFT